MGVVTVFAALEGANSPCQEGRDTADERVGTGPRCEAEGAAEAFQASRRKRGIGVVCGGGVSGRAEPRRLFDAIRAAFR